MSHPNLHPAADHLAGVVAGIRDEQLADPTPCPDCTVGDLLDHVGGLGQAFAACARKELSVGAEPPPPSSIANLDPQWRTRIPADLRMLAEAWDDPQAWTGMSRVGGVDVPGEVGGLIALDEIVIHAWDLARATGQPFRAAQGDLQAILPFLQDAPDRSGALFGPIVAVADDAPLIDRVIGLAGRDPAWQ
jgi:uncharacterized protein (TIGR03086 family)